MPGALGRVLRLVRKLIDYGRQLAATAQQHAGAPDFAVFARRFGTADIAAILARITNGLRRAAALEARLCQHAKRGRDLVTAPVRLSDARGSRIARQVAPPDTQPQPHAEDPWLTRLPTEAEIAAEVRRRPVGAVIVDICHELGIAPGLLDRAFWDELSLAIMRYGGSLARFFDNMSKRRFAFGFGDHCQPADPACLPAPLRLPAPVHGPP